LTTTGWLVTEKVLPSLLVGDPPNYLRIAESQNPLPPVGWTVLLDDRPVGWSLTDTKLQPSGLTEIHGRVHFDAIPIEKTMPGWLRVLSPLVGKPIQGLRIDAVSELFIDAFGRLYCFNSSMRLDRLNETVSMHGTVEGHQLEVMVRTSAMSFTRKVSLPSDALLADALSPQTRLPGLHVNQEWTVPEFNPLMPSSNPMEIVHASVKGTEPIIWNGTLENAWVVEYRADAGNVAERTPRGKLWVRRDGAVLRQQTSLLDMTLTFVRMSDDEAANMETSAGKQWWILESEQRRP
jgi:hypothetical protein